MDVQKLADRYAEIRTENAKRPVAAIKKLTGSMAPRDKVVANLLREMQRALESAASRPLDSERKFLLDSGVGVVDAKADGWTGCLKGYTVVSDLYGHDADAFSGGLVLKKGGKRFFSVILDQYAYEARTSGSLGAAPEDAVAAFLEHFSKTVALTRAASKAGAALKIRETFVCFHSRGYAGHIVFEGRPGIVTWQEYVSGGVAEQQIIPSAKNRAKIALRSARVAGVARKKMELLHENGIIFSFNGYRWLESDSILVDMGPPGSGSEALGTAKTPGRGTAKSPGREAVPVDIFPMNYSSAVMAADAIERATADDFAIIERLQKGWEEKRNRDAALNDLAAVKLRREKFFA
jgi:hypothetical protein